MVEVFKTDVKSIEHGDKIVALIHRMYDNYKANFDLDDCDCILRIECSDNEVAVDEIISMMKRSGFNAEVLSDEVNDNRNLCPSLSRYYNIHLN